MNNKLSAKLDENIKKIVKREGYITFNVDKRKLSSEGGGYNGLLSAIDVKGKTKHEDKETNIFVKQIIPTRVRVILDMNTIYKREEFVYTNLIKHMYDLQDEENVPIDDRFKAAAVFDECNDEMIILENLTSRGFKTYFRKDVINLQFAELAVKELARFHGLSLAMQKKRPDYFENNIKTMECLYIFDDYFQGFRQNMRMFVTQFLAEELRDRVTPLLIEAMDRYPAYINDNSCIKTICHGDFRHNNIMVKEIDGKPTEVIAVDFQITHFGNPVLDFIYFIFWGTDQQFRKNHLQHLKQLYHQYLGTFLRYFSINVEEVFPKEEFENQYREKLDFGLMISVCFLPFLFPSEKDVTEIQERKKSLYEFDLNIDDKYAERLRGIVDDFINWGYLKV